MYNELETYKTSAGTLSELLVPKNIPSHIDELVILPTGRLSIIPFEVLFIRKTKNENAFHLLPYLLTKYNIRYEFSAALILQKSKTPSIANKSIFLCAPVTFEKDGLGNLPGTESEVVEISQLFASKNFKSEVFTRMEADEQKVKEGTLKDFGYLHFATHGIVDETNPELSRIYLHSSSTEEDGNLYAGEIYTINLNADLVTLSACQTGLGKISKGEGVIGLSRALAYAGAKNIIVSFWSVADQSTANLMKAFYRQMLETSTPNFSGALRQAKLNLIQERNYASPFYWAPFILIGF
jgi:CHAT domain-containing protein